MEEVKDYVALEVKIHRSRPKRKRILVTRHRCDDYSLFHGIIMLKNVYWAFGLWVGWLKVPHCHLLMFSSCKHSVLLLFFFNPNLRSLNLIFKVELYIHTASIQTLRHIHTYTIYVEMSSWYRFSYFQSSCFYFIFSIIIVIFFSFKILVL